MNSTAPTQTNAIKLSIQIDPSIVILIIDGNQASICSNNGQKHISNIK